MNTMPRVRPPAVAGLFYPADPATLDAEVAAMLATARQAHHDTVPPKALIVPHAGYVYSGPVAASAYARLEAARTRIRRVVLLGPVHRVPVRGLALPDVEAFDTPLGRVPLDAAAVAQLRALPQVVVSDAAHAAEHSLEVHLPFLQKVLDAFTLVPLAVGEATSAQVREVLDAVWGGEETLVVVSSDLSHYLPYDEARKIDAETAGMILTLRTDVDHRHACGGTPVNGLMEAARARGLQVQLVDLRNSGDTAGTRDRVVGYGSFVVHTPDGLVANAGSTLVSLARASIAQRLGLDARVAEGAAWLRQPGATFVTLTRAGELRGCIGSLEAKRPLLADVKENALAAAFSDPRFKPVTAAEWPGVRVEVSLLSPLETLECSSEAEALAQIRPGVDGLVIEYGHHRGTFLPQVWESLPEPGQFLLNLKRKAGLPPDFWEPGLALKRYTVTKWHEREDRSDT